MQRLRPCRSPYTEVHSRLCTDFSFFGYARYQLGSCALRRPSAAVARLPLHCWRLWSRWLHWDQLRGSRRHPPHLLVELVLKRREPLQPLLNRSSGDAASRPLGIGWAHACAWARAWLPADAPARWSANSFVQQGDRLTMAKRGWDLGNVAPQANFRPASFVPCWDTPWSSKVTRYASKTCQTLSTEARISLRSARVHR